VTEQYGLTGLRDKDGDLQNVDYTYEWAGETVTIQFRPPTLAEQEELEDLDEDEPAENLESLLDDHMVKPSVPDDGSWTAREMWCYISGILRWSMGGENTLAADIEEEIDERTDGEGN